MRTTAPQQAQPVRRRRRLITKNEIYDAAIAIVDADGLRALSMRRLAEATGVGVMTLYGFFDNKEELVSQLGTHALGSVEPIPNPALTWQDQLMAELRRLRSALQDHPGLIELLSFFDDAAPNIDRQRDGLLAIIRGAGIDDRAAVDGLGACVALTLGFAVGARARHIGLDDHVYERLGSLPPMEYPHLSAVATEYASHWSTRAFEFGVRAILDEMVPGPAQRRPEE